MSSRQTDDIMQGLRISLLDKKTVAEFIVDEEKSAVIILNTFYGAKNYEAILSK